MSMEKENANIFIRAFAHAQKETGLTQNDVAIRMSITQPALSHYVTGLKEPGLGFMERVAEAFGYDLVDFLALGRE